MSSHVIGVSAALASAVAWAVGLLLLKVVKAEVSALGMTLMTGLMGTVLLGLFLLGTGGYETIPWRPFWLLGVSGLIGITLGDTFFFAALDGLSAHLMVLFNVLGQAFTVVLAVIFLGETVTARQWAAIALIVAGVAAALYPERGEPGRRSSAHAIMMGNLSVLANSSSIIVTKMGLAGVSAVQGTFIRMLWGVAGVTVMGLGGRKLVEWLRPFADRATLQRCSLGILVGTFGGFLLFHIALKNIPVSLANPLGATEPLFTIPLAAIFLGEKVKGRALVGSLVAVAGAVWLCF